MSAPSRPRVDALGLLCPLPVLRAHDAARGLPPGAELEVDCDDPRAPDDLRAWCAGNGHVVQGVVELPGRARPAWRVLVRL